MYLGTPLLWGSRPKRAGACRPLRSGCPSNIVTLEPNCIKDAQDLLKAVSQAVEPCCLSNRLGRQAMQPGRALNPECHPLAALGNSPQETCRAARRSGLAGCWRGFPPPSWWATPSAARPRSGCSATPAGCHSAEPAHRAAQVLSHRHAPTCATIQERPARDAVSPVSSSVPSRHRCAACCGADAA